MKKYLIVFIVMAFLTPSAVWATVGGPTYIHDFRYNPADESVYYKKNSSDGRGCPTELHRISLNSEQTEVAFSCDQGEKLLRENDYDHAVVTDTINKIVENFKNLSPISLKANGIAVDLEFVNAENLSPELDEVLRRNFMGTVYQGGRKVAELSVSGCNMDQPFIFGGYAIPGFNKKIVMLLSAKEDCFEGGYVGESLYVVGGLEDLDKEFFYNSFKGASALVPSEGTLVVFEMDRASFEVDENAVEGVNESQEEKELSIVSMIAIGLVALLAGVFFGRLWRR